MISNLKRLKVTNSRGDTIVEVLIVLAILSLAFAMAFATANQGLQRSRNAEEHSEALGVINSQVELLRAGYANRNYLHSQGHAFCLKNIDQATQATSPPPEAKGMAGGDTDPCLFQGIYHVQITYNNEGTPLDPNVTSRGYFNINVTWEGLGKLGTQNEDINYKVKPMSDKGTVWADPTPAPPCADCGGGGGGGGPPPAAIFSTCTTNGPPFGCQTDNQPGGTGGIYSCVNNTFNYSTANLKPGRYTFTINYASQVQPCTPYPPRQDYSFNVDFSVAGSPTQVLSLPASTNIQSRSITVDVTAAQPAISIAWGNDDFIDGSYDANLKIHSIIITPL